MGVEHNVQYKSFDFPTSDICDYIAKSLVEKYGYEQRKSIADMKNDKGIFCKSLGPAFTDKLQIASSICIILVEKYTDIGKSDLIIDDIINSNYKIKSWYDDKINRLVYLTNNN